MGGGLMQLVAIGAQDVFLTGNPQITFFKVVYKRHTNFSKETIQQKWSGSGIRKTCTLSRNGDLVQEIYMQGTEQTYGGLKSVEVEIGGQKIDKHYGTWLAIYDELFETNRTLSAAIVGDFLPLQFWFNRNPGLALPLIALQYHEVKIVAEWHTVSITSYIGNTAITTTTSAADNAAKCSGLLVNYVYLDTDERRRFAQVSHEYLIEQVQHTGVESIANGDTNKSITLTYNHPVKALFWSGMLNTAYNAKLQLNGHDRFSEQPALYFTGVQPYECGLRHPKAGAVSAATTNAGMYSFCLKPGEHQPSGSCNFSRIDNARLVFSDMLGSSADSSLSVFALNYNVLRVMSGMGGLTYSN